MAFLTVSPKYQIVIPKEIRERLKIVPGQKMKMILINGRVEIIPIRPLESYRGIYPNMDTSNYRDEEDREI
jgi:AbrB family looped-hinge helix DNA binding protein